MKRLTYEEAIENLRVLEERIDTLTAENERLREALTAIIDAVDRCESGGIAVWADCFEGARTALSTTDTQGKKE